MVEITMLPVPYPVLSRDSPTLENLPTELRIQILLRLPDLASLRSLVHASPSYHALYLKAGRQEVLGHIALHQLDYWLRPDALALVRSANSFGPGSADEEAIQPFISEYGRAREELASSNSEWLLDRGWLTCRSIGEALQVLRINQAINLVADDYCLFVATQLPQAKLATKLSKMEQLRLYRSLYRYQIWCNFMNVRGIWTQPNNFLITLPPWEIQEMVCVWHYLMQRWRTVFREVSGLTPSKRRGWQYQTNTPLKAELAHLRISQDESSDDPPRVRYARCAQSFIARCKYLAYRGPAFLARTLAQTPLEERRDFLLVEAQYYLRVAHNFDEAFLTLHNIPHLLPPANRYEDPGILDILSQMPKAEQPSRGWEWFCDEYCIPSLGIGLYWEKSCRYGLSHPNNMPQYFAKRASRWGFPFWDEERLIEWGVIVTEEKKEEQERQRVRDAAERDARETSALMHLPGLFDTE